jgi:hypothetical protein
VDARRERRVDGAAARVEENATREVREERAAIESRAEATADMPFRASQLE